MAGTMWDLSGRLREGMWSYAELGGATAAVRGFSRRPTTELERDGFETEEFCLGTHTGTYIESARHLRPDGRRLDEIPLARFVTAATLIRLPDVPPRGWIRAADLDAAAVAVPVAGQALLIDTGWGRHWDAAGYLLDAPAYAPDCAEWIRRHRPGLLAVDVPAINSPRAGEPATTILEDLFAADGLLLAPVRFDPVPAGAEHQALELIAWPLAIEDACATPCRAVLRTAQ